MKYFAVLALASVVVALPADNLDKRQGVTAKIAPSAPAPSGCKDSFSGKFAIDVVPVRTKSNTASITTTPTIAAFGDGSPTGIGQVSQIADGQLQAGLNTGALPTATASASVDGDYFIGNATCNRKPKLTLNDGILKDDQGRTGYIASNRQFQFDDPPQSEAIYTAGFSVCQNGTLSFGGNGTFVECASGTFYNLYDETIAYQCQEIKVYVLPDMCDGK